MVKKLPGAFENGSCRHAGSRKNAPRNRGSAPVALLGAAGESTEWETRELVLLMDQVALLKRVQTMGGLPRHGRTLGHEVVCDFFCCEGKVEEARR